RGAGTQRMYVRRPRVEPQRFASLRPPVYSGGLMGPEAPGGGKLGGGNLGGFNRGGGINLGGIQLGGLQVGGLQLGGIQLGNTGLQFGGGLNFGGYGNFGGGFPGRLAGGRYQADTSALPPG